MSPVVALIAVIVAVTVVLGVVGVVLAGLRRRRSRTTDQASTIFALRTALVALVQAATQGYDVTAADGQGQRRRVGTPWAPVDAAVRPKVVAQLSLIQDNQLRQLADELLDATRQLGMAAGGDEGESLCREVDVLHERFRARSNEVVRELSLRRVTRQR